MSYLLYWQEPGSRKVYGPTKLSSFDEALEYAKKMEPSSETVIIMKEERL